LAPAPPQAAAEGDTPFANLTVGNVTAARENALRKALLEGYEKGAFPWVSTPLGGGGGGNVCADRGGGIYGGELLHVDMFAHNKSGIAYRDGNRWSKTVVNHKREPHQQLRLLPSRSN
jgi:hypothetical protein